MNRFARFVYETPEGAGGAPTLEEPEETPAIVPLRPDGQPITHTVDPVIEEPAPITAPELEETVDPDVDPEQPVGDPLKDTQRAFHQSQAELKAARDELEAFRQQQEEPGVDPLAPLSRATATMTEDEAEQMRDFITADPLEAFKWARTPEAKAQWGPNIANDVLGYWQREIPGGYEASTDFLVDERVGRATAPILQRHAEELGQQIEARLTAELPTWTDLRSRVEELYQEFQTEMGFKPNVESPQAAEKLLRRLHAIAHAEKHPGTAPSAEAIPPSPGVLAAQTQSGSRAAAVPASEQARYEEWAGPAVN